ncbi:MAG TPA: NAD(P)(+) transhydrogenase (Re/Si-specific) subunit beta [Perlabentimonas sp.]|nr:NAD(P)(+) transhydrogenase (Re/Si-specific) subunit beta [Bacteroidales bacterium]MDD4673308.1 NAD(P)(+) transhydrogenase (Re/Si-specific) subunit beta [Bacteroidales bacterium]MDY0348611.1 NAD(P)(+) transhydrogenase (Re/Si-specific) subunit beta [Tenuifilaceae bacterium]HZJ73671.1 NAD(P)(+) transhydrogenase (Re/Si-specific) subunit beta [Perlabentimonas sp.]
MDKVLGTLNGMEFTIGDSLLELSYLIAALLFVYGLKLLSHPASARRGNLWAAGGMGLAMITTLFLHKDTAGQGIPSLNMWVIIAFIAFGAVIGLIIARKVKMTAMPQLVSLFNASGGAASMLVALLEYPSAAAGDVGSILVTVLGLIIGSIAFSGSVIAYGKLDGKVGSIIKPFMTYLNLLLLLVTIAFGAFIVASSTSPAHMVWAIYTLMAISIVYGITFVMPIGGADMPVVISLLNALTGVAAAMAGFIYSNQAMILGGILVGAAGMILTMLMCKAMNRSLINVIIGAFGSAGAAGAKHEQGTVKEIQLSDAAVLLSYSQKVVIIPGYGLAVAQAQHIVHELDMLLEDKGVEVKYAIHPVAGRMPGHMNVLLAEADVPYEQLIEMDAINPDMPNVDVAIVVGANDVVNPAAHDDPSSPIHGMPIIDAHLAKNIIIMKRGMGKGYAGIENALFFNDKASMLFGDAKSSIQKLVNEIKSM